MADDTRPASKVAQLLERYDLGSAFGDQLEERWTADDDSREGLRSLAKRFNKRLLATAMSNAGMSTLDGEVETFYQALTDDDVSSGVRAETRTRLRQEGVDVDQLQQDFVTYQAIRTYLKDYRGVEYDHDRGISRPESLIETIQRLKSRVRAVARTNLEQLREQGTVTLGEFRVFVEIDVLCEECNAQYGIVELLRRGGCDCRHDE